jgi:hypothetical protein
MSPPPTVGVLLPLRIETKFTPPQGQAGWIMRVRVTPDIPSVDRHDPLASETELASIEALWRNCGGNLTSGQGIAEWRALCARHGAGRAAWLARTFPPVVSGGEVTIQRPAEVRTDPRVADLAGLPPEIQLWLQRGGGPPVLAATLTLDPALLRSDPPDPSSGESRWWSSYATAAQAGLATEIDLGPQADDIDVLYAVGVGGGDPAPLFAAHRDAGELAVLPLGAPTNTVDGEPAADLAQDPETWRQLVLTGGSGDPGTGAVSTAITGRPETLAPLPGGAAYSADLDHHMVAAMWPGVFGFGLKNLWSIDDGAFTAGQWALDNLLPQGPVPPIRIGNQPYGVLPVTDLRAWRAAPGDPPVEEQLCPSLVSGLHAWATAAETAGTTAGADTGRLLQVLSQTPSSAHYSWRWFAPLELLHPLGWGFGSGVLRTDLVNWWDRMAAPVSGYPVTPTRRYGTLGYVQDVRVPLVQPDNLATPATLADVLHTLAGIPPRNLMSLGGLKEFFPRLPNSLLFRLALFSLVAGAAEVARARAGERGPMLELPYAADTLATELATWVDAMDPAQLPPHGSAQIWLAARGAIAALAGYEAADLERSFTATVDTAAYRLDPWLTGIAWRRLQALSSPVYDLGVYGWVDTPAPATGQQAPAEFLLAPSAAQAMTTAILRDRALSDDEPDRWHMDLTSDRVRLADQLAGQVRLGSHLTEVLGGEVERVVAAGLDVERLRSAYPIRTEHAGRRVCDGLRVLQQLRADPSVLGLADDVVQRLGPLAEAIDVYADLLVADAVMDVVSGRTEQAAPAMDAAAGLSAPPELDVIRTQRHGRGLTTAVVAALPAAAPPPRPVTASSSPGRITDPSVAAYLDTAFGAAGDDSWTWTVQHPDGATITPVTLADLGLAPVDTAGVSGAALARTALAFSGAPGGSTVSPQGELPAHAQLVRFVALLGGQPALGANLADDGTQPDPAPIAADLLGRFTDLTAAGQALAASLTAAAGPAGTDSDRAAALRAALAWGVTPLLEDEPDLVTAVIRARDALAGRLAGALPPDQAAGLGVLDLARAITELASGEGRLPVLARHRLDGLPAQLIANSGRPAGSPGADPDWLEVVAPVRRPLARIEAHQLGQRAAGGQPLAAWTNSPGDPWLAATPASPAYGLNDTRSLVVAFGPPGVLDPAGDPAREVAIVLLDSWSEAVPATGQPVSVALHVDAPKSRPPQAILVAVPPDPDSPLDVTSTLGIITQARELAHARAATPDLLDDYASALPLTMLPVSPLSGGLLNPA